MVDVPNKQTIPPAAADPLKKMPKIEGPKLATNASQDPKYSSGASPKMKDPGDHGPDLANKDQGAKFELPDNVSQQQIKDQSFKYGGGRSAGNRSMEDNFLRKENEQ